MSNAYRPTLPPPAVQPIEAAAHAFHVQPASGLYLDSAAQGPRLRTVLAAGHAALEETATPWKLSFEGWRARIEALRQCAAQTLFAGDVEGLAMVPSVAYALATAARNAPLQAGERVLVLEAQFPSNLLAWQQRCAEAGAELVAVRRRQDADWTAAVLRVLQDGARWRVVALPQAHWHDGALLDLDRIAPQVHALEAMLVLDLSQSLGAMPVKLDIWRPDFIASVGHKWLLGPTGLAWLWASPRWRSEGMPIEHHWQARDAGGEWEFPTHAPPPWCSGARRFDAGGVADGPRLAMAAAAMAQLQAWTVPAIGVRLGELTHSLDSALQTLSLERCVTVGHAPHLTALRTQGGAEFDRMAAALADAGIVCTRRAGLLRIAPHLHVSTGDMQRVARLVSTVLCR